MNDKFTVFCGINNKHILFHLYFYIVNFIKNLTF